MRPNKVITLDPQAGNSLSVVGDTYRMLLTGEQTDNKLAVIDMLIPPGGGPGPHAHASIIETFYVIDGEVVIRSETQTYTARKGATVTIPMGGAVHMFKNETDKPAHLLCIVVPSGLEAMFQEIGQPVAADEFLPPPTVTPDWIAQMQAVAEKHGQEVFPPDYFETK